MTIVAGTDGCPGGWISISRNMSTGELYSSCLRTSDQLIHQQDAPRFLAVDIPIGLTQHGQRLCDVQARRVLGRPRSCSVFPPPVRGVLAGLLPESTRAQASDLHRQIDGRGISAQAWGILWRIHEVDEILRLQPSLQSRIREVHPEVSFWAWAGGRPMRYRKKARRGREERRSLVNDYFGRDAFEAVRARYKVRDVGHDDVLDAFAALWTAERMFRRTHQTLPEEPPLDSVGLRMEIVY